MCGVGGKVGWAPPSYLKKCTAEKADTEGESDDSDDDFMATPETCEIPYHYCDSPLYIE